MHFMDTRPAVGGGRGKACQLQFGLSQSILQLQLSIHNLQHIFTPSRFVSIVCLDMYTWMLTVWLPGWQHREAATHPIPPDQPRTGQSPVKRLIDKLGQPILAWWLGGLVGKNKLPLLPFCRKKLIRTISHIMSISAWFLFCISWNPYWEAVSV